MTIKINKVYNSDKTIKHLCCYVPKNLNIISNEITFRDIDNWKKTRIISLYKKHKTGYTYIVSEDYQESNEISFHIQYKPIDLNNREQSYDFYINGNDKSKPNPYRKKEK